MADWVVRPLVAQMPLPKGQSVVSTTTTTTRLTLTLLLLA
jgi:hypothetical protein